MIYFFYRFCDNNLIGLPDDILDIGDTLIRLDLRGNDLDAVPPIVTKLTGYAL